MTISRMFSSTEDALGAVAALAPLEFTDRHIRVIAATPEYVSANYLVKKGVFPAHADAAAARVRAGEVLVIVDQPMGYSESATELLASAAPRGGSPVVNESISFDEATPFSSLMGWPTLMSDPTPFASFWNLPSSTSCSLSSALGLKTLSASGPVLGIPTLTKSGRILPF